MKNILMLLLVGAYLPASSQSKINETFDLKGKVTNQQTGIIYLRYTDKTGNYIVDSTMLQNGNFNFHGKIDEPTKASFSGKTKSLAMDDPNYTSLFLEPTAMEITVADQAFKEADLKGSVTQYEYKSLRSQQRTVENRWKVVMDTLHEVNKRSNAAYQELKDWVLQPYNLEMDELLGNFLKMHPTSYVTAYFLCFNRNLTTDSLTILYTAFPNNLKQSSYGKAIAQNLENQKKGVPGTVAASFATNNINGKMLNSADFKGKYVLLDFWASWCVPCRKGNPHLKELYTKYKAKGFDVIGVSDDDRNHEAWKRAVEKDRLPWNHVLRGMKMTMLGEKINIDRTNDISDKFNISSLPTQILVDPSGHIIGRYGDGGEAHEALDKKLETIFK